MHTSPQEPHLFSQELPDRLKKIKHLWQLIASHSPNNAETLKQLQIQLNELSTAAIHISAHDISTNAQALSKHLCAKALVTDPKNKNLYTRLINSFDHWQPTVRHTTTEAGEIIRKTPCQTTIYLIEETTLASQEMSTQLSSANFCIQQFNSLHAMQGSLNHKRPDAIIMNIGLNQDCQTNIKAINDQYDMPIPVIMTATRNDMKTRLTAVRAGAVRYFTHPIDYPDFIEAISGLTLRRPQTPYRVLVIEDDKFIAEKHRLILSRHNIQTEVLTTPLKTLETVNRFQPELILTDLHMPECSGQELTAVIRQDKNYAQLPIIFLSSETDKQSQMLAMGMGGDDFITKPVQEHHLIASIQNRLKRYRWLSRMGNDLEKTLRETQYQRLAMDEHAIVSITNPLGEITYANEKFCNISQFSQDELVGQHHRILNSHTHPSAFFKSMWETISRGDVWQGDVCNRNKSGQLYWIKSTTVPFLTPQGQPYQYVSVSTDITSEKTLENELRTTRDHLNLLLNTSPIILYNIKLTQNNINIEWVSDNTTRLLGIDKQSFMHANSWEKYIHPDDKELIKDILHTEPAPDHPLLLEYRLIRDDGSELWVQDHIKINSTEHALNVVGAWTDHTKFHDIQHQLIENEERLRRSQRYANIGTWDWNIITGELIWSERIAPLLGLQKGTLTTSYDKFIDTVHPDDRDALIKAATACIQEGIEYNIEHRCIWPNGETRWLLERGDVLRNTDGTPQHMLGVVQDITQQKFMAQALQESKIEAEKANQAKSQFLSSMSHELRTPMHAILGFAQLMTIDPNDPLSESHQENIEEILKAGQHLLDLINEVLDLAKIESGKIAFKIQHVLPQQIIQECISLITPLATKHSIKLFIDSNNEEHTQISIDPIRFRQIILNLLSNAVKYNQKNGEVHLKISHTKLHYKIEIRDTGKGIPQERLSELFKPFSRLVDDHIPIEGSGIGLVVTKELVERMNGKIGVESTEGIGSTFWVTLPVNQAT